MKVVFGLPKTAGYKNTVAAIGVFDGMHLGHRRILGETVKWARRVGGTAVALTFFPHPRNKESLYSLEHRLKLIKQLGIDVCIVIRFGRSFSRLEAKDFVADVLVKTLRVHDVYVGENFRFGRNAAGDCRLLAELARKYNFRLKAFPVVRINHLAVSSTRIRKLIVAGRLGQAEKLLAAPVSVFGTVIRGKSLAAKMGFPTANLDPHHEVLPPPGVYAVKIIYGKKKFSGACYIGRRPTFIEPGKQPEKNIEVHIFNFHRQIYGKHLEVHFIRRLRKEKKFAAITPLIAQIKKDIKRVKSTFFLP